MKNITEIRYLFSSFNHLNIEIRENSFEKIIHVAILQITEAENMDPN